MLFEFEIIWMGINQVIRLWNDINFSETPSTFLISLKATFLEKEMNWLIISYILYLISCSLINIIDSR